MKKNESVSLWNVGQSNFLMSVFLPKLFKQPQSLGAGTGAEYLSPHKNQMFPLVHRI